MKRNVEHHYVHKHISNGNIIIKCETQKQKKIFKDVMSTYFPNLLENDNLYIQQAQQTPNSIKVEEMHNQTHTSKNNKSQRQGENLECSKRKMTCHIQENPVRSIADF